MKKNRITKQLFLRALGVAALLASAVLAGCGNNDNIETLSEAEHQWLPYEAGDQIRLEMRGDSTNQNDTIFWTAHEKYDFTSGGCKHVPNCSKYEIVMQRIEETSERGSANNNNALGEIQIECRLEARDNPEDRLIWDIKYEMREPDRDETIEYWHEVFPRNRQHSNTNLTLNINGVTYENVYWAPVPPASAYQGGNRLVEIYYHKQFGFLRFSFDHGDYDLARE